MKSQNNSALNWKKLSIIYLAFIAILCAIFYFAQPNQKTVKYSRGSQAAITPTPTLTATIPGWKVHEGKTSYVGAPPFTIEYPGNWTLGRNKTYPDRLYPFGESKRGFIQLGAGGHGGMEKGIMRNFPAGQARYYWIVNAYNEVYGYASFPKENYNYIFEVKIIPAEYSAEYEKIFNQMLSTFRIVD